ncbi:hypothetical protein COOONC_17540, partial [Cooperia oncophora]
MSEGFQMICLYFLLHLLLPICMAKVCFSDSSCPSGMRCTPATTGYSICTKFGKDVEQKYPSPPSFYCNTNRDCARTQLAVKDCHAIGTQTATAVCNALTTMADGCVWKIGDTVECSATIACPSEKKCIYSESKKKNICVEAMEVSQPQELKSESSSAASGWPSRDEIKLRLISMKDDEDSSASK